MPHVYKITICLLCTDIDIPVLKYLARYTYLNSIFDWITTTHSSVIGPFRKNPSNKVGWGNEVLKGTEWRKSMCKLQGLSEKEVEFPRMIKSYCGISMGLGFWMALEFPRDVAKVCRTSRDKALFSPEFPRVKWQT